MSCWQVLHDILQEFLLWIMLTQPFCVKSTRKSACVKGVIIIWRIGFGPFFSFTPFHPFVNVCVVDGCMVTKQLGAMKGALGTAIVPGPCVDISDLI